VQITYWSLRFHIPSMLLHCSFVVSCPMYWQRNECEVRRGVRPGLIPGWNKTFFSSPKCPDQLWGQLCIIFCRSWRFVPQG
jgi:hypothetical protein